MGGDKSGNQIGQHITDNFDLWKRGQRTYGNPFMKVVKRELMGSNKEGIDF
jgi:hypothetical protein